MRTDAFHIVSVEFCQRLEQTYLNDAVFETHERSTSSVFRKKSSSNGMPISK